MRPLFWAFPVLVCISLCLESQRSDPNYSFLTGANREVKKAVEAYWAGTISADQLTQVAADVKKSNWTSVKSKGVDYIPRLFCFLVTPEVNV